MALETGTQISDLVDSNPIETDQISKLDDHIRLVKTCIQGSFPNKNVAILASDENLNQLEDNDFDSTIKEVGAEVAKLSGAIFTGDVLATNVDDGNDAQLTTKKNLDDTIAANPIAPLITDVVMSGTINGSDGATIKGTGFTSARAGAGVYNITFDSPITDTYVVVVSSAQNSAARNVNVYNETTNGFTMSARNMGGAGETVDHDIAFTLVHQPYQTKTLTIINPGFETGDFTGWSIDSGSPAVRNDAGGGTIAPYEGNWYAASVEDLDGWFLKSDPIDLVDQGLDVTDIDAGIVDFIVYWYQIRFEPGNDPGRAAIRWLNASQVQIGADEWSPYGEFEDWTHRNYLARAPANTRYVQIRLHSKRDIGDYASAFFDLVTLQARWKG